MKSKPTATFSVGMQLPKKLSKEARRQLTTGTTPQRALDLADKAARIAKRYETAI